MRNNTNLLIVFKLDDRNLRHTYDKHWFEKFKTIFSKAWEYEKGFLLIDKEKDINNGRYRIRFENIVTNIYESV